MKFTSKEIQLHYLGFLNTPCLWINNALFGLNQFQIESKEQQFNSEINTNLRLGKYIERFVSFQLEQQKSIKILLENIQIQNNKITIGELDCLLINYKQPIHLEIIYKFYLYDDSIGNSEIEHFIGPNKKDALIEKLNKLNEKQLPLLYSSYCKPYLEDLDLSSENIKQLVYFKAQLFLPYRKQSIKLDKLNQDCIIGFYINKEELSYFKDCKFYIPNKKDWLIQPKKNVNWMIFDDFNIKAKEYFAQQFSPLTWVKNQNGLIDKVFLVWW